MPQEEVYNTRDQTYSAWHRRKSTMRFIGIENAQLLAMIDLDVMLYVEYDDKTKEPLGLVEVAIDVGQPYKTATVTANLAKKSDLPCLVVLYKISENLNPSDNRYNDIEYFRVKRLWPEPIDFNFKTMLPIEYAEYLIRMRKYQASKIDKQLKGVI